MQTTVLTSQKAGKFFILLPDAIAFMFFFAVKIGCSLPT